MASSEACGEGEGRGGERAHQAPAERQDDEPVEVAEAEDAGRDGHDRPDDAEHDRHRTGRDPCVLRAAAAHILRLWLLLDTSLWCLDDDSGAGGCVSQEPNHYQSISGKGVPAALSSGGGGLPHLECPVHGGGVLIIAVHDLRCIMHGTMLAPAVGASHGLCSTTRQLCRACSAYQRRKQALRQADHTRALHTQSSRSRTRRTSRMMLKRRGPKARGQGSRCGRAPTRCPRPRCP